jgi:hypothetical protein
LPAITGSGESVFETDRSAEPTPTVVVSVALLLPVDGSAVVALTVAVLDSTVPPAVPPFTFTTSVKFPLVPARNTDGFEQLIAPVPPTAGVVQTKSAKVVSETNVVFAGTVSANATPVATLGPTFERPMV